MEPSEQGQYDLVSLLRIMDTLQGSKLPECKKVKREGA